MVNYCTDDGFYIQQATYWESKASSNHVFHVCSCVNVCGLLGYTVYVIAD